MSSSDNNGSDNSKSNQSGSEIPSDQNVKETIDNLHKEVEKYKNEFLYLRAEFDTYKRNAIKERSELMKYGSERIIVELLGVMDNFERALQTKASAENIPNYVKGIEMTATELKGALGRYGVTEMPCEGLAFDPMSHEALSAEESSAIPAGHVLRVFKKAYKLHDKLIRPAQVVVAKKPETSN